MITRMTFDFEVNRCRPQENLEVRYGRVTVEIPTQETDLVTYLAGFYTAHAMVYGLRSVEMVTALELVL